MSHLRPTPPYSKANDSSQYAPTIELTVRFSASLPDLPLSLPAKPNTTTATLKQLIRNSIPNEFKNRRIRLIYAGKALIDDAQLTSSLRLPSRPPSRVPTPAPYETQPNQSSSNGGTETDAARGNDKDKGKEVIRDPPLPATSQQIPPPQRIYIHCSIGDVVLDPTELAAEMAIANRAMSNRQNGGDQNTEVNKQGDGTDADADPMTTTTTPAPRGFERLLTAGFSAAEVQSLRLQFMAIQSHTHTPDTMPSPNTLRDMEDSWLDNGNEAGGGGMGGMGGGALDEDAQTGTLDDMIWGATMGFFWPIGCLMWGTREEGIWSQRRKMAVVVGVVLNIGIAFVKFTA